MKTLILGLGNELLGDDAVGILAARALKERLLGHTEIEIVESALSGVALLELFIGYERAIIIDAIQTGRNPPGTISELNLDDLGSVSAPSPHYTGLPELLALARHLRIEFPSEIRIFALEAEDPYTIGAGLSATVREALPALVERILRQIE